MRNVDEIKRLNYELGRQRHLAQARYDESEGLRRELEAARGLQRDTQAVLDAALITAVMVCGRDTEDGAQTLVLPAFDVDLCLGAFKLEVRRRGGENVFTVSEKTE